MALRLDWGKGLGTHSALDPLPPLAGETLGAQAMPTGRGGGMLRQVGRCWREGLSAPKPLTWPRGRRCRCPRCSPWPTALPVGVLGPARPSRLGSAPPAPPLGQIRMRRYRRRASSRSRGRRARRAPGTLSRPRFPCQPPPPAAPTHARPQTRPRRAIHSCRARRQRHTQCTLPRGHTLPHSHTHAGSHTASQGLSTSTRSHCRPLIRGHAGSNIQSMSRSHKLAPGPAVKRCPTASHTVKHSNRVTTIHVESYTSTHVPHTVAHFHGITEYHRLTHHTRLHHHTASHTFTHSNLLHTHVGVVHPAQSHTRYTVTGHK